MASIAAIIGGVYLAYGFRSDIHIDIDENNEPQIYRDSLEEIKEKKKQRKYGKIFLALAVILILIPSP